MNREGWSTGELATLLQAELHGSEEVVVSQVLTDSRRLSFPSETVFFSLKSFKNDGHRYIPELVNKGVRVFVVDHLPRIHREDAIYLVVSDTMKALHDAAKAWRSNFTYPVVGITGSNGKTVVKEWIHQLLNSSLRIVRSPRSYNSQIGVPLSLFHMRTGHQLGVFEAGISQVNEMAKLRDLIQPTWGIFTNIGDAHQEHFSSVELKLQEKLILFEGVRHLVYSSDSVQLHQAIQEKFGKSEVNLISWGENRDTSSLWIQDKSVHDSGIRVVTHWKGVLHAFELPFIDDASFENAMHCLTFALAFGMDAKMLAEKVQTLTPVAMRLELKKARGGSGVINDYYNSDPQSVRIALDFTGQQVQYDKRIVILSDIEQSGVDDETLYPRIAQMLKERRIDLLIGIGEYISKYANQFHIPAHFFANTEAFISEFQLFDFKDSIILLKGARTFAFEKIAQLLEERVHQTILEIDLSAVAHNFNYFRKQLLPETKIMAMVKAFGYGIGYHEIASVLAYHNVDYLTVAFADEGVALREAGIQTRIMVMNPGEESYDQILEHDLEPEIYSFSTLNSFYRAVQRSARHIQDLSLPIHIKVDTGMHRLGFDPKDMDRLSDELLVMPGIRVQSVFSHLAASDDLDQKEFTQQQLEAFKQASERLEKGLGYSVIKHILNSSGIHNYSSWQMDMVRLGIGLYGVSSMPMERSHLLRVSRLTTRISQLRNIPAGESVGYSRAFVATKNMRIATLPVGYADGIDRRLSNGVGEVCIRGQRAPIVGNVCMDMVMVDVSSISCVEGDEVEIFGEHISIYEFAERTGTIPYEVLTSISPRVKRVYFQE